MITLDSKNYSVSQTNYGHKQDKFASVDRGLTGLPLRVEGGAFENAYDLTLLCDTTDITNLRTSFAKTATIGTPATNLLDFIDEEGVEWSPSAGSDDSTHRYSTGVYFISISETKPLSVSHGWTSAQRFLVTVKLLVNSANLSS
jgi:hypothetical protein